MSEAFCAYELVGEDGYPPEWHRTIKHLVREQASHRCIRCGHPYRTGAHGKGEWTPCDEACTHGGPMKLGLAGRPNQAAWRILTVHHLDGDKSNCRWWNLAALCQRCHLTIQGRVRLEIPFHGEHSDWFKPYVAGFYAFKYLHEEIDRAEAEARLEELLALELRGAQLALTPDTEKAQSA